MTRGPRRRPPGLLVVLAFLACEADVAGIAAHACALLADGSVWCWGYNSRGELGDGSVLDRPLPVLVQRLPAAVSVASGEGFTCAATEDGRAFCWGRNDVGQLGLPTDGDRSSPQEIPALTGVARIAAGASAACALHVAGGVSCWGEQGSRAYGGPIAIAGLPAPALEVALDDTLACARLESGEPWCWTPGGEAAATGIVGAVSLAVYRGEPCAVLLDGSVTCAAGVPATAVEVSAGPVQACARLASGAVWCWGEDHFDPRGMGWEPSEPFGPTLYASGASAISVGVYFGCAVQGGQVACWGDNWGGQLGDGTNRRRSQPVRTLGIPVPATAISAGTATPAYDYGCGTSASPWSDP